MENLDIRYIVRQAGLKYVDIAKQMGISKWWLSKLMRYKLSKKNRKRILQAIRELKECDVDE